MNIEEFLKMYKSEMIIKEGDDWGIIGLPFFHLGHSDGIAIRFFYKNGELVISDCHTTMDYLDANDIDLEDYPDRLEKIMKEFDIFLDGNVFRKIIPDPSNGLYREIGYFIEAISIIAHIDL